jgi:hypothetical protein
VTQQQIREQSRARYALDGATSDDLFTDAQVNFYIDEWHRTLADLLRCYQEERSTAGSALVTENSQYYAVLAEDVLDVDPYSVQVNSSGTYTHLKKRLYRSLVEQYGPLQSVSRGTPLYWYERPGSAAATIREIGLLPAPDTTIAALTPAIRYRVWYVPADLTTDSGVPDLAEKFHRQAFVPSICRMMAETEFAQGRLDAAVVELWKAREKASLLPLLVVYGQDPAKLEAL